MPGRSTHLRESRPHLTAARAHRCLLHTAALGSSPHVAREHRVPFAFRATDYYAGLIDWSDPADAIRRLIVPTEAEAADFGSPDASDEAANTVVPGLQHKYADTALLLVTDQCAGFCRYCFRKRLFTDARRETLRDWSPALAHIASHPEITDVLLSGGDPLTLRTADLRTLIERIIAIPHVRTVRIGSKVPAFDPGRIADDPALLESIAEVVASGRTFYLMAHFDHPRELGPLARRAISLMRDAGAECLNQCPLTAGINDDPAVLAALFQACTDAGCPQYYVFQCRPTTGNAPFVVPITRGMEVVSEARTMVSGLSRRARFSMSHASGKIEVVGVDEHHIYARYHRAKDPADEGRMLVYRRDDAAAWADDLVLA